MATQKDKESRGVEFPKGTLARLEAARRRHGDRSINERLNVIVLAWLDEDEKTTTKRGKVKP